VLAEIIKQQSVPKTMILHVECKKAHQFQAWTGLESG
jgi:hypothetical protein